MWNLPPMKPDGIILYLRKSRTDDPILSVEEVLAKHEQMLDEWVERNLPGLGRVPEENRYREVVSGETLDSRPKVQEVLRRIESPRIKAVLIVEPQRLSRGDLEDIGRLVKLLRYSNTLVLTLQYSYDLRDERDRDAFERELKRGNEFLEYTKRIMYNGRLLSVENGNFIGNTAPYGYRKIQIKEGKKKTFTLEPVPEEAAVVHQIFEMYRDGYSSHGVARALNEQGLRTQKGAEWSAESLHKMRTNEHYLGKIVWNRRKTVKTIEDGELISSHPINRDYLVFPGKHPPIIEQELWDAVQEIRARTPPVEKRKMVNSLAGILFCECGGTMNFRPNYRNGKKQCEDRLLCSRQPKCHNASCLFPEMIDAVVGILTKAIQDFDTKIQDSTSDRVEQHRQLVARLERQYEELEKREIAQWDKYTQEGMPKLVFDQLNAKVLAEKENVERALSKARNTLPEPIDYERKKQTFHEALEALQDPSVSIRKKNILLKQCIERIVYTRKRKAGNRRWGNPEPMTLEVHLRV